MISDKSPPGTEEPSNNEVGELLEFPTRDSSVSDDSDYGTNTLKKGYVPQWLKSLNNKTNYVRKRRENADVSQDESGNSRRSTNDIDGDDDMPYLEPFPDDQVQEKEQTKPWINGFYAVFNAAFRYVCPR